MIIEREGNLFDFEHQAYAHGVNNKGSMGMGIATSFKNIYPEMYQHYRYMCYKKELQPGDCLYWRACRGMPAVFNLVTQESLIVADANFLRESFRQMFVLARKHKIYDIAIPEIGCGHGELNRLDLDKALSPFLSTSEYHVTLYQLNL